VIQTYVFVLLFEINFCILPLETYLLLANILMFASIGALGMIGLQSCFFSFNYLHTRFYMNWKLCAWTDNQIVVAESDYLQNRISYGMESTTECGNNCKM